jgi:hypothetical protein
MVYQMTDLQPLSAPPFNTMTKNNTHNDPMQLEINCIITKSELISSKIEDNQVKRVIRFKELENEIKSIKSITAEKCSCFSHLEAIVETQNYLCE